MITVQDIYKTYTTGKVETPVLKGISFHVDEGEFVAIMGKSGAGKSTLLYQISLLDRPTSGNIQVAGTDILSLNDRQGTRFRLANLGFVFQDYALVPDLSAEENVMVPLLMLGMSWKVARAEARTALDRVGLEGKYRNLPNQLSGGEQQRVSIARAVAQKPTILFADEPTANLDSNSSQTVIDIFSELHAAGQTIVMVTHEPEYTSACDRIIYLADGKVERDDILPSELSV